MAHNCPECGNLCHCKKKNGDIDDLCWDDGSNEALSCFHWKSCEGDEDDDDYWFPAEEFAR